MGRMKNCPERTSPSSEPVRQDVGADQHVAQAQTRISDRALFFNLTRILLHCIKQRDSECLLLFLLELGASVREVEDVDCSFAFGID